MKRNLIFSTILIVSLFGVVPDIWAINVASSLCQEKSTTPGTVYTEAIKIINNEKNPVEIRLYQTDYHFSADGTNQYGEPGKASRSNAGWITKLPQRITLAPEQITMVPYSVTVPRDQTLSGSYWCMIMVEKVNPEEMEALSSGKRQLGIRQMIRYGVQVVTHIGDSGVRQLAFSGLKLVSGADQRFLQIDMANSGTRALRPMIWVDLYAENGGYGKKINGEQRRIYPECSIMQKFDLSEIPAGAYKAVIVADAGEETVFGTSFSIQLKE